MADKVLKRPYDPLLPPAREIIAEFEARVAARRGTRGITRGPGDMFIMTCTCGTLWLTCEPLKIHRFETLHEDCLTDWRT